MDNEKKILILCNNDIGLYKFRKELINELLYPGKYLNSRLMKKSVVYVSVPYGSYVLRLQRLGCKCINTPISRRSVNPVNELKLFIHYFSIVKKIKPDVVLTYTIKPNIYGGIVCSLLNTPYIVNITGLGSAVENVSLLQKIVLFLYKISLRKANKIFFQNSANRDFMIDKNLIHTEYDIIPGSGVNLSNYMLLDYPDDDSCVNFAFIARIMKEKGIEQYIDAAKIIKEIYPHVNFHIYGFCEENYSNLISCLEKRGIVIYHGQVDNMVDVYKDMSCVIHPTYYSEGMSNVLLESAASGRPIIASDRPGCREIIDDKVNGFLVKERDTEDLVEKIKLFLNLSIAERKAMGINGRKKVEKDFDRKIVVKSYLSEIEKSIKR